jgi:hypothetical protein
MRESQIERAGVDAYGGMEERMMDGELIPVDESSVVLVVRV